MNFLVTALISAMISLSSVSPTTPEGLWRTIDDETGRPKALVRITANQGVYSGKIEKILLAERANAKCDKCTDERKNQPVLGMEILRHLVKADDEREWADGEILDPKNGKVYRARAELSENGMTLDVRGYIGLPVLGRTQTWQRVE